MHQLKLGLLAQLFVQRAQGLIQQQQLRLLCQTAGQGHALLLPAGQLVRLAFGQLSQLHELEHLVHPRVDLPTRHAFTLEAKRNVVPHAQVRKQRIRLEHHVDGPLIRRQLRDVHTVQDHRARRRFLKTRQHAQQCGLATPRTSQQGKNLTLADGQRYLVNCHHGLRTVESLDELPGLEKALTCQAIA